VIVTGRVALVTGAARRLGRATAEALAARGARVAVHYRRSADEAARVVAGIRAGGGDAEAFAADLGDVAAVARLADDVEARLGPPDVLVNNASVYYPTPLATLGEREWDESLAVNLTAPYLLALRLGRAMQARGTGKIVNLGDAGAGQPYAGYLPYCVSKVALEALTRALARELAPAVQVNCVAPGPVLPPARADDELRRRLLRRVPLGRFGTPADVAAAVLFLVEHGDFVTGTTVRVDGGRALT
jgi:pteridine reductase